MSDLWEVLTEHLPEFTSGLWVTLRLVAFAFVIAMVVGTLVAALRIAPNRWLNRIGGIYVETFRNTPLLVLLIIVFSGFPRAGVGVSAVGRGHVVPRALHRGLHRRGAALGRVRGRARARSRRRSRSASPIPARCGGSSCRRRSAR